MSDTIRSAAKIMAENMKKAPIPMYGNSMRLPNRRAVIELLDEVRRLMFPAYYGDPGLMDLPAEEYMAMLLSHIQAKLTEQVRLALPESQAQEADRIAQEVTLTLPALQENLLKDLDAIFDGDPAAQNKEEVIFAYPGLYAIFAYRLAHELYIRQVPMLPRIITEHAHSRTGIDIHPGASIGDYFFIDHGTGIVIGETSEIGSHVKLYQGVTLGALSLKGGRALANGKRHPTVKDGAVIYSNASILGGETEIGENSVVGGNAFLTSSVEADTQVVVRGPETHFKTKNN